MNSLVWGALPCVFMAQAVEPLTFDNVLQRARSSPEQLRTEALLASRERQLRGTRGFLRDGPSLSFSAGPRTSSLAPTTTDQTMEVDLPLFFSQSTQRRLEKALGNAHPALKESARIELHFRLRQAYLDVWLSERVLRLREADLATVQTWLKAARVRLETGADPVFQVSLVEGELLKAQVDLEEARRAYFQAWTTLRSLATVPEVPVPVADPGNPLRLSFHDLPAKFERSSLQRAIQARLELEEQALRHQEALSTSRWSLRGSTSKEGEERITKVGIAYRFPRPSETRAIRRETEANLSAVKQELAIARVELETRFNSAMTRLQGVPELTPFTAFDTALRAIGLRLSEGKERPSEALPIRRQLLEAQVASLRRVHAVHLLNAELQALTDGNHS